MQNLTAVDAGFDRSRLVTFSITLPPASFDLIGRVRAYQRILEQLRAVPGVRSATAMTGLPLDRQFIPNQTEIANSHRAVGAGAQRRLSARDVRVFRDDGHPDPAGPWFSVQRCRVSRLRRRRQRDAGATRTGRAGTRSGSGFGPPATDPWFTVIGVAKDVKQTSVDQPVRAGGLRPRRSARDRRSDHVAGLLADDDARGGANDAAAGDAGADDRDAWSATSIRRCRSRACARWTRSSPNRFGVRVCWRSC